MEKFIQIATNSEILYGLTEDGRLFRTMARSDEKLEWKEVQVPYRETITAVEELPELTELTDEELDNLPF